MHPAIHDDRVGGFVGLEHRRVVLVVHRTADAARRGACRGFVRALRRWRVGGLAFQLGNHAIAAVHALHGLELGHRPGHGERGTAGDAGGNGGDRGAAVERAQRRGEAGHDAVAELSVGGRGEAQRKDAHHPAVAFGGADVQRFQRRTDQVHVARRPVDQQGVLGRVVAQRVAAVAQPQRVQQFLHLRTREALEAEQPALYRLGGIEVQRVAVVIPEDAVSLAHGVEELLRRRIEIRLHEAIDAVGDDGRQPLARGEILQHLGDTLCVRLVDEARHRPA